MAVRATVTEPSPSFTVYWVELKFTIAGSLSRIVIVAVSATPLRTPMDEDAAGMVRLRLKVSGSSATLLSVMGMVTVAVVAPGEKVAW